MAWYRTGTITVTAGVLTVAGASTSWLANVVEGDILFAGGTLNEVSLVGSDISITLADGYLGATGSGIDYAIIRNFTKSSTKALIDAIDVFLADRQVTLIEFTDWMNGEINGGPNNDGFYPLTDINGVTKLVKSPAQSTTDFDAIIGAVPLLTDAATVAQAIIDVGLVRDETVAAVVTVDASVSLAEAWAENPVDDDIVAGKFSALHHSAKAAAEVVIAQQAVTDAQSEVALATAQVVLAAAQVALATAQVVLSQQWAENPEDSDIGGSTFSALHWAAKAAADLLLTNTDVASTNSDVVSTGNDVTSSATSETNAAASAIKAGQWAEHPADTDIPGEAVGTRSAEHWAAVALGAAGAIVNPIAMLGSFDASTGSPPAIPATGSSFYKITVAGIINTVDYGVGDSIVYDPVGLVWFKIDNTESVTSVDGQQGIVVLPEVTTLAAGKMSAVDKIKLNTAPADIGAAITKVRKLALAGI